MGVSRHINEVHQWVLKNIEIFENVSIPEWINWHFILPNVSHMEDLCQINQTPFDSNCEKIIVIRRIVNCVHPHRSLFEFWTYNRFVKWSKWSKITNFWSFSYWRFIGTINWNILPVTAKGLAEPWANKVFGTPTFQVNIDPSKFKILTSSCLHLKGLK